MYIGSGFPEPFLLLRTKNGFPRYARNDMPFFSHCEECNDVAIRHFCHCEADLSAVAIRSFKSTENLIKYPTAELKKSKYENMLTAHTNTKLIYIQYINETAIIFDMDKLNWNKVRLYNWRIKHTEYDDDSEYEVVPTYFIPYYQRLMIIDAHQYFEYYANNQFE